MSSYLEREIINIIRLKNSENVSKLTFFKLIEHFGDVESALLAIPELLGKWGKKDFKLYPLDAAKKDFENCKNKIYLLYPTIVYNTHLYLNMLKINLLFCLQKVM